MPQPLPTKPEIRSAVRASRARRSDTERASLAHELTRTLISLCEHLGATTIACYTPLPGEPDTTEFIRWAHSRNLTIWLPLTQTSHTLRWGVYSGAHKLTPGPFGILEPTGPTQGTDAVSAADLMIIPASSVAYSGVRLGWGRGFYDRCIASLSAAPPVFAVVHADEFVPTLPAEPHDRPVNGVVTPQRWQWLPVAR